MKKILLHITDRKDDFTGWSCIIPVLQAFTNAFNINKLEKYNQM